MVSRKAVYFSCIGSKFFMEVEKKLVSLLFLNGHEVCSVTLLLAEMRAFVNGFWFLGVIKMCVN